MYPTTCATSAPGQVDGWCLGEGISLLFSSSQLRILIDALALLIRGFEVLADPAPELATGTLRTIAELHDVQGSTVRFNRNLTKRAAQDLRGRGHGSLTMHDGTLVSAPTVVLLDQLQP